MLFDNNIQSSDLFAKQTGNIQLCAKFKTICREIRKYEKLMYLCTPISKKTQ